MKLSYKTNFEQYFTIHWVWNFSLWTKRCMCLVVALHSCLFTSSTVFSVSVCHRDYIVTQNHRAFWDLELEETHKDHQVQVWNEQPIWQTHDLGIAGQTVKWAPTMVSRVLTSTPIFHSYISKPCLLIPEVGSAALAMLLTGSLCADWRLMQLCKYTQRRQSKKKIVCFHFELSCCYFLQVRTIALFFIGAWYFSIGEQGAYSIFSISFVRSSPAHNAASSDYFFQRKE